LFLNNHACFNATLFHTQRWVQSCLLWETPNSVKKEEIVFVVNSTCPIGWVLWEIHLSKIKIVQYSLGWVDKWNIFALSGHYISNCQQGHLPWHIYKIFERECVCKVEHSVSGERKWESINKHSQFTAPRRHQWRPLVTRKALGVRGITFSHCSPSWPPGIKRLGSSNILAYTVCGDSSYLWRIKRSFPPTSSPCLSPCDNHSLIVLSPPTSYTVHSVNHQFKPAQLWQNTTIFRWVRHEGSLVHDKVLIFKVPCCQGQLAPFPRKATSFNKKLSDMITSSNLPCKMEKVAPDNMVTWTFKTLWPNFSRALLNWKS